MAARKSGCLLRNVPVLGGGGTRSANATDLPANVGWALAEDGTIIYRDTESGKKAAAAGALGLYFSANGIAHEPPLPSGALVDAERGFYIHNGGMFPNRPRSREFTAVFGGKGNTGCLAYAVMGGIVRTRLGGALTPLLLAAVTLPKVRALEADVISFFLPNMSEEDTKLVRYSELEGVVTVAADGSETLNRNVLSELLLGGTEDQLTPYHLPNERRNVFLHVKRLMMAAFDMSRVTRDKNTGEVTPWYPDHDEGEETALHGAFTNRKVLVIDADGCAKFDDVNGTQTIKELMQDQMKQDIVDMKEAKQSFEADSAAYQQYLNAKHAWDQDKEGDPPDEVRAPRPPPRFGSPLLKRDDPRPEHMTFVAPIDNKTGTMERHLGHVTGVVEQLKSLLKQETAADEDTPQGPAALKKKIKDLEQDLEGKEEAIGDMKNLRTCAEHLDQKIDSLSSTVLASMATALGIKAGRNKRARGATNAEDAEDVTRKKIKKALLGNTYGSALDEARKWS
mmetsp:Transcript_102895/g.295007  ORF Transcript_102895/g.295007 Transcript_102895/m.295007 type:complete len:509 (+) Transcript_102895:719-2245(+)